MLTLCCFVWRRLANEVCVYSGSKDCFTASSILVSRSVLLFPVAEFKNAPNLQTVAFEASSEMGEFREEAFYNCKQLTSIEFPPQLSVIGVNCFSLCSQLGPSIDLPASLTSVGQRCFQSCTGLQYIHWDPDCTVTSIPLYFAEGAGLVEFEIFPSLSSFSTAAITSQSFLKFVMIGESTNYNVIDGILFSANSQILVQIPAGITGNFTIPATTETINDGAFRLSNLEFINLSLAVNLTSIGSGAFKYAKIRSFEYPVGCKVTTIVGSTFSGCSYLKYIKFSPSIQTINPSSFSENTPLVDIGLCLENPFKLVDGILYTDDMSTIIVCLTGVYASSVTVHPYVRTVFEAAFYRCHIDTVIFSGPLETIGNYAFHTATTTQVIIPADSPLAVIPSNCFARAAITSFTFPMNVKTVNGNAFVNSDITLYDVPSDHEYLSAVGGIIYSKDETSLMAVPPGLDGVVIIPAKVKRLMSGAFYSAKITEVGFESGSQLEELQESAFESCTYLHTITFDRNCPLSSMGLGVFKTSAIEEIILPDGIGSIKTETFNGCEQLKRIELPAKLVEIQQRAFKGCPLLSEIVFPVDCTIRTIGANAFTNTPALHTITLPLNVIEIDVTAFSEQTTKVVVSGSTAPKVMGAIEAIPFLKEISIRCGKNYVLPDALEMKGVVLTYWCATRTLRWHRRYYVFCFVFIC